MREMVRPTSAADISSRPFAASLTVPMRDGDLLLRLSGRIVKGCRLPGSVAPASDTATMRAAWRISPSRVLSLPPQWPLERRCPAHSDNAADCRSRRSERSWGCAPV
ncbi:hypothetical protein BZL29_7430 [Mycobacterium kansasii]|uniref:Uncharacterized protein n=1 Tax=Mycobacterium kansasii TaxID=1768 RepID=A0A1V3WGP4_MYCKA|nr:hypothetical protein BZL29_7430 [Mycobacterium kansasii]